jgi:serine/threonine protein kinase
MTPETWREVSDLFSECLRLEEPDREAFLAGIARPELAREVRNLLQNYDESYLEKPATEELTSDRPVIRIADRQRIGRYEITGKIGDGGMSAVYRALDPAIGRPVAIKFLFTAGDNSTKDRAEFFREVRILGNIRQNDVVSVYDCGEFDGLPYIVMECLEGQDLSKAIAAHECGSLAQRAAIARQIAEAMEKVHSAAIVHRDLKPANVFIEKSGRIKLMDFGIARSARASGSRATRLIGTPQYISPEQIKGQPADFRSDIYSYGILLFELFTETSPFQGGPAEVLFKIVYEGVPTRLLDDSAVPPPLIDLIRRATARDPNLRPQTFHDVIAELASFESPAAASQQNFRSRTRMRAAAALVTAALCVVLGGGIAILHRPTQPANTPGRSKPAADRPSAVLATQQPAADLSAGPRGASPDSARKLRTEPEPPKRTVTREAERTAMSGPEPQKPKADDLPQAAAPQADVTAVATARPDTPAVLTPPAPHESPAVAPEISAATVHPGGAARGEIPSAPQPLPVSSPAGEPKRTDPMPALQADAKQQVLKVLERYSAAYRNRQLRDVLVVFPSLDAEHRKFLRESFSRMTETELHLVPLEEPRFVGLERTDGPASATLKCRRISKSRFFDSRAAKDSSDVVTLNLERKNGVWTILSIE